MQISRYEKGQSRPSFDTMIRLGTVLQVSLDVLVSGSEIPEPPPSFRNTRILARMRELDELLRERRTGWQPVDRPASGRCYPRNRSTHLYAVIMSREKPSAQPQR